LISLPACLPAQGIRQITIEHTQHVGEGFHQHLRRLPLPLADERQLVLGHAPADLELTLSHSSLFWGRAIRGIGEGESVPHVFIPALVELQAWIYQNEHTVAAENWGFWRDVLGLPAAILAGITSAAAFSQLDRSNAIAGLLALVVTVLTATSTYLNPSQKTERHRVSANSFRSLRYEADMFSEFSLPSLSDSQLIEAVQRLMDKFEKLVESRPEVSPKQSRHGRARATPEQSGSRPSDLQVPLSGEPDSPGPPPSMPAPQPSSE
jgi:hypothetical protein